jgi:hypothetical protein
MFFRMNYPLSILETPYYAIRYSITIYHCVVYNFIHSDNWCASYIIQLGTSFQEKDTYVFCSHYVNDLNERDVFHATLIRPFFTRNALSNISWACS